MAQHSDPDSFGFLIADITRLSRAEMDRRTEEAGLGLTLGDGRTLSHAARAGAVRQNVLAERMAVEAMTLSSALDRLESRGLIERRQDPDDRRAKLVDVTAEGEAVLAQIQPIGAGLRADASRGIAPADWQRFLDTLRQVRANLTEVRCEAARRESATE
ncbi:MAG TPA: MarR family transcriptional regulator [Rhizobiaceae bacterium]|jgi:DNA-binding MarR family transcriptional regulator|nr:MarR family transcriptional regulator [Rhizobiaceae bacterium]